MTVREHMALRLAAARYGAPGRRLDDALEQLGLTPTRYWALVNRLLDDPDVLREMPVEISRLRRVRDGRRGARGRRVQ